MDIGNRRVVNIGQAMTLTGVSRRTIYNWLNSGKVEYVRTPGGSVRIFTDTLWNQDEPTRQVDQRPVPSNGLNGGGC